MVLSDHKSAASELREQLARRGFGESVGQRAGARTLDWGHEALRAALPGAGWPLGALTELLTDTPGIGELQLLLPALRQLARQGRQIVWIAPPYLPYAPALRQLGLPLQRVLLIQTSRTQESLWAFEQTLRCPAIGAALAWDAPVQDRQLRRLQLAAEAGGTLGILYRPSEALRMPSPAALRLQLRASSDGESLMVEISKYRGGRAGARVCLKES